MRKAECTLLKDKLLDYIDPNILDMEITGKIINRNTTPPVQIIIDEIHPFPKKVGENGSTFEIETTDRYPIQIVEGDIIEISFYKILVNKII